MQQLSKLTHFYGKSELLTNIAVNFDTLCGVHRIDARSVHEPLHSLSA